MSQFLATTGVLGPTSIAATAQILSLGVRIYSVYAELSHRPMVLINESWTPLFAAVVAAVACILGGIYTRRCHGIPDSFDESVMSQVPPINESEQLA